MVYRRSVLCSSGEANGDSAKCFHSRALESHAKTAILSKLVIGNWNISSLTGKEHGLVEKAKQQMLAASLRPKDVALNFTL